MWCTEFADGTYGSITDSFDSIVNRFKESYDNVTINVTAFPQDEYLDKLAEAIDEGKAPDLFLSSGLDKSYLTDAYSLESLAKNYYKNNCIFYSQYNSKYHDSRQIPLGFTYPVVYVNTAQLAYDKDTAKNMKDIIGDGTYDEMVCTDGEGFYDKKYPAYAGSTSDYSAVSGVSWRMTRTAGRLRKNSLNI